MNIILPIIFAAIVIGLISKKIGAGSWLAMSITILLVVARYYAKN